MTIIMVALCNRADHYIFILFLSSFFLLLLLMAALRSRCGHYIFVLFLLFFIPRLISVVVAEWMSTVLRHMMQS